MLILLVESSVPSSLYIPRSYGASNQLSNPQVSVSYKMGKMVSSVFVVPEVCRDWSHWPVNSLPLTRLEAGKPRIWKFGRLGVSGFTLQFTHGSLLCGLMEEEQKISLWLISLLPYFVYML